MSTLVHSVGRPGYDWEVLLQQIMENGAFTPIGSAGTTLTRSLGTAQVIFTGTGLLATGPNTVTAGTITGFTIIDNGQTVLSMTGLTSANFADLQTLVTGSVALDPYSEAFKAIFAPFFTDEPVNATGSNADESTIGSAGVDTISGNGGDDYIRGAGGVDNLFGGAGRDVLDYRFDTRTVGININLSANTVVNNNVGAAVVDNISGFEDVLATAFDDIIRGNDADNALLGYAGNDTFYGMLGDNYYQGGAGNDTFYGGTSTADGQWDKVSYEDDTGPQGIVVTYLAGGNISVVDTFGNTNSGFHIEEVKGSARADTFNGNAEDNRAEGMGGADTFNMGAGWDQVSYEHEADAGTTRGVIVNLGLAAVTANIGFGATIVQAGRALDTFGNTDTLAGVEQVRGTQYSDYIVGSALDNELNGGDGFDVLFGGAGNDNLRGDEGGNFNQGNDVLYGGDGDDRFKGGAGNDFVDGGNGFDRMRYDLETTFTGDDATHGVIVNMSNATLTGVSVAGIAVTNVGAGTAIDSRNYIDTLISIEGVQATGYNDLLVGGVADEDFDGSGGANSINGGDGDDYIIGGAGSDVLNGGIGFYDTASYEEDSLYNGGTLGVIVNLSGASITVNIGNGNETVLAGRIRDAFGATDIVSNFEEIRGTSFYDYMVGSGLDDRLEGGDSSDALYGGAGADQLRGDEGGNVNQGNDYLYGGAGDDSFKGGAGTDYMDGGGDRDWLDYNSETTFTGDDATHGVIVNLSALVLSNVSVTGIPSANVAAGTAIDSRNYIDTLVSIEDVGGTGYDDYIAGSTGDNYIEGNEGSDRLYGGAGADHLNGGAGNDSMYGGAGDDYYEVDSAGDVVSETGGDGFDTVRTTLSGYTLGTGFERLEAEGSTPFYGFGNATANDLVGDLGADGLYGGGGDDYLEGNDGADALAGGTGSDDAFGGAGADILLLDDYTPAGRLISNGADYAEGGDGDDLVWGFGGDDDLFGDAGNDTLVGNDFTTGPVGNDQLYGGDGNDSLYLGSGGTAQLYGGTGNDTLFGYTGSDTLNGGLGNDYMYGNAGADVFQFFRADLSAGNADIVYFVDAADKLRFSANLNGSLFFQNLASLEWSPGQFTTGVYITAFLGAGATATITVYGTTVAALTPMVEYTL